LPEAALSWLSVEDQAYWQAFEHHSRTFSLAARLLPAPIRTPVSTLYLFCRTVDSVADLRVLEVGAAQAQQELADLRQGLEATLVGTPGPDRLWQRLAEVHARYGLYPAPLFELIDGAAWDLAGRPVVDEADLIAYSNLVGGSIGAMMLPFLCPPHSDLARLEPPARALGIAMQITNIVRDVGEDWRELRRVYLPCTWLEAAGIAPEAFAHASLPPGYAALIERMMALAERYFDEGLSGIEALPPQVRTGIRAAARFYREILNEVRARGYDNLHQRAVVPLSRKLLRLGRDGYGARKSSLLKRLHTRHKGGRQSPLG
jgi:phytoene synthase